MRINAIIQARFSSTRLPGKVLMELGDKPVLCHVIERLSQSKHIDRIIVATSVSKENDGLAEAVQKWGAPVFRGSESDVLSRYFGAAVAYPADAFIRITADCPLIDPVVTDRVAEVFLSGKWQYVSNGGANVAQRTYPRGLDVEIFSFSLLEKTHEQATESYEREHVTPYMYWKQDSVYYVKNDTKLSQYRWTLDTPEDYCFIKEIFNHFYNGVHDFYMEDIVKYLQENPGLMEINREIEQKKVNQVEV